MKTTTKLILMLVVTGLLASGAQAATSTNKKSSKKANAQASVKAANAKAVADAKKNSRDIRFNGSTVDGKYLTAGETIAEVEGEKEMGALIGLRKNFRDKLKVEQTKLASGKGQ